MIANALQGMLCKVLADFLTKILILQEGNKTSWMEVQNADSIADARLIALDSEVQPTPPPLTSVPKWK